MWITGHLGLTPAGDHLRLNGIQGVMDLYVGSPLELRHHDLWRRGRLEYNWLKGWHWTDDRQSVILHLSSEVRVWDGRDWPQLPERSGIER